MQVTLKAMRANANMSQAFVADKMGINITTLIRWEKGISAPDMVQFGKLCELYRCSRDDIFLPDSLSKSGQ